MDIWAWVNTLTDELAEAGQQRVVDLVYRIPNLIHEHEYEQVEALLPEALSLARSLKNPWLEVFFRHWGLNNRLTNVNEGESALNEASTLFEFAHRDDTLNCPHSICVTQDLASCYGNYDGIGYVPERLAVVEETIARIDPTTNCFDCLSREYATALIDGNRSKEAIDYMKKQAKAMKDEGEELSVAFMEVQAECLIGNKQYEEALKQIDFIDKANAEDDDAGDKISRATTRAYLYACLGRLEEAQETLPQWADLVPNLFKQWAKTCFILAQANTEKNNWRLGVLMQRCLDHMLKVGAYRDAIEIALIHGELAVKRGALWVAKRIHAQALTCIPKLRALHGADTQLAAFEKTFATVKPYKAPVGNDQVIALIHKQIEDNSANLEEHIEWLVKAQALLPDEEEMTRALGTALRTYGAVDETEKVLWAFMEKHPESQNIYIDLLELLLEKQDEASIDKLATYLLDKNPPSAHWCRARLAYAKNQFDEVGTHVQALLKFDNTAIYPREMWARACMKGKNFKQALQIYQDIVELSEENKSSHWDIMMAATCLGDWKTVRASAKVMELEIEPGDDENAPIDEQWGRIRILFFENGEWVEHIALRTGPVTAKIFGIARGQRKQHVCDIVAFEPSPLEEIPEDEEAKKNFIVPYQAIHTLHAANYKTWQVDGAYPGDDAFVALRTAIFDKGYVLAVHSSDEYRVANPKAPNNKDDEEGLQGIYFSIGVPPEVQATTVHAELEQLTKGFEHPWCWYDLANDAKADLDKQINIIETYKL